MYRYTPYWIRREVHLETPARKMTPLVAYFDDRFTHWGAAHDPETKPGRVHHIFGPHYDQVDDAIPAQAGVFFRDPRPPGWMNLFRLGGEAISIAPTGNLAPWHEGDVGDFSIVRERGGVRVQCDVPIVKRSAGQIFASFITLPNLPASRPVPLRTVMVGNPPFPSDALLRAWSNNGVDLIVIMEGASWVSGSDRYWRVGDYPCYHDPRDMRDLDRLVRSAHRFGMRIIPYTCPTYLHPEVPIFHRRAREWRQASVPNGQVIYHPAGKSAGGCYGALMCSDSKPWRDFYFRHVKMLLTKHDFDGVYVDNVWKIPCHNTEHMPGRHGGLDGLWEVLGRVRALLGPERLMVIHMPKRLGLHDGIAKALVLGTVPYSYAMWETRWGYKDGWECLSDPRGIYAAFRKLKSLRLDGLQFHDCFTSAVRVRPSVFAARPITERDGRSFSWQISAAIAKGTFAGNTVAEAA